MTKVANNYILGDVIQMALNFSVWKQPTSILNWCSVLLGILLSACTVIQTGGTQSPPEQVAIDLYYATDRKDEESATTVIKFGNQRGELSFGTCQITINTVKNRRTALSNNGAWPASEPLIHTWDAKLIRVSLLSFQELSERMEQHLRNSGDQSILLYIHGYAKSFEESAENLARFVYEINYQGAPLLYSWPSKGSAAGYHADTTTLDWSSHHLETVLSKLSQETKFNTIHIVAHSLGNRGMLKALSKVIERQRFEQRNWKFGEVILLAPDVDKGLFARDWAPGLQHIPSRVTLYLSSEDFPLKVSKTLNQYPRLGDGRFGPLVYPGIETIDVSEAITPLRGHSYFRKANAVLTDLHYLINQRRGAYERPNLHAEPSPDGYYWLLRSSSRGDNSE